MGEPSSSWQNFNFRDDEGSAQGMQALRLLLAKLQEAQANPRLKPSVNNLLMTEDLMLTSTQRLPSSVAPMHLEGGEGVPVMHGPMQANVVPHPLQGPLQTDGAKKKQYHGQERHVGKIREEGDFHDDDDEPPSRSRHKKRTNEQRTKRSRRNSSGGSSSSSQSGRSSHGRFPKKEGHAIAYESRRLSSDEQILGIYEKDLLAVLHARDSWKHYLLGTPFILRTDHQSLKYFMTQTKLSDKQMRWANFLSRFNFHIAHIAGKHNQVADALSRRPKVNAVSIAAHNDLSSMIDEYAIDSDFKDVISAIALGKKEEPFTLQDGYLLHGNRLCITRSLREKVMFESHAPPYAGHRGIQTTMKAIETYFYWPTMKGDIQDYVSKCVVCQKTKYDRGKQHGLLQPLPIPDSPWESISMDFIFGLPKSIHGNIGIWTIVDRFSKQAHFIPVKKTIKAHQMATLLISQVFKYHGLPTSIVSDRDPRMTSNFCKGLFENLGTRLNFSSTYHPQTDGQSEIANLTVLDLLKAYVTEVDQRSQWEKYLPLVEYAYNNTVHTSTGKAPFEVIEGRSKSPLLLKVHGKIFAADEYSRDLNESFQKIKEAISIAQQKQKAAANKHRRALAFKENDWVLL
ncbi:hypothetical protein L7F22_010954 [Adiantum nelumboides]|nr:hypothetical protein [Adiantum nelumboides]